MSGRTVWLIAAAALVGVGAAAPAAAGTVKVPGTVVIDRLSELPQPISPSRDSVVYGHVETKQACLADRKVVIDGSYENESGLTPYDVARTGKNGGFSGIGASTHNGNDILGVKLVLEPKSIGTRRHPKTCKGDTFKVLE
jgi:hypothetical protein